MQATNDTTVKLSRKLAILGMAAASTLLLSRTSLAGTDVWTSTASGTSGTTAPNQLWLNSHNWASGIPGTADIAQFNSTAVPSGNKVDLDFADGTISTGAITDILPGTSGVNGSGTALTFSGLTTGTLTLNGATVTVPVPSGTQTSGSSTETYSNTILASTDTSALNKSFVLDSKINIALPNATNNILDYAGAGGEGKNNAGFPYMNVSGNIVNAGSTAAGLTFLGGGSPSVQGGELVLSGTNTFSGGLTIGNAATSAGTSQVNLQAGEVYLSGPAALPTTGTITVNEQSQLGFAGAANYSTGGQTLILNGIGMGKNISGALRPTGGTQAAPINWLGNIQLGTSASYDGDNGAVLITVASTGSWFRLVGSMTGGNFIEQGGGVFDFAGPAAGNTFGSTQLGNGGINVEPQSGLSTTGDVILFQTSNNNPTLTLNNAAQTIGSLSSQFTATSTTTGLTNNVNGFVQNITLNGTALTVTEPANTSFGYGSYYTLTSGLNDGSTGLGSLILNSTSGHTLTMTAQNTYSGGTIINAGTLDLANNIAGITVGSALGSGPVQVNHGGILATGNYTVAAGFTSGSQIQSITGGTFTGQLNVASGGIVSPGGGNVGFLNTGPIVASAGSIFNFSIASPTAGNYSTIASTGSVNFDTSGFETINITGSTLAVGTFNLITGTSVSSNTSTGGINLGTTPAGRNRIYALSETGTQVVLTITNTGTERDWSLGGGVPAVDGSGTWQSGSINFYQTSGTTTTTQSAYNNALPADTEFGNGGNGGVITLGSSVTVGGAFILGALASGQSYTFVSGNGSNSLTLTGGVAASNSALISAPVLLAGSQTWSTDSGVTLSVSGNIAENVVGSQLTKSGTGILLLTGTGSWTGGTIVSQGTLQTTASAIPTAGGVTLAAGTTLDFDQTNSGTYSGLISGSGAVTVSNLAGTGSPVINFSNPNNTYTGSTTVSTGALLSVAAVGNLGTGDGGIILSGGTLQATSNLLFPLNPGGGSTQKRTLTLTTGTTSTVDTQSNTVEFDSNIGGAGSLVKIGSGTLVLEGIPSTTNIGGLISSQGTIEIDQPLAGASFIFSGSPSPTAAPQETGTIDIHTNTLTRLGGGYFNGGGSFKVDLTSVQIIGYGVSSTVVGNTISLNPNNTTGGFTTQIGADTGSSLALNGPIIGNSDVDFTGGKGIVTLGGSSTYTGATTIDNSAGGYVQLSVSNALPQTTDVTVTNPGVLDLNGNNQTIASLSSTHTGSTSTATVVNTNASSPSVLTITGSSSTIFSGSLTDSSGSATLGLTLNGAGGALALSGEGEYSGPTTILAGRLDITAITTDAISGGNVTGLGATDSIIIGASPTDTTAQLRFSGINGPNGAVTIQFNPTNYALNTSVPTITLNSLGGYTAPGSNLSTGAIRVSGNSQVILTDPIVFNGSAGSVISVTDTSTLELDGQLSGTGSFISQGSGLITLVGNNTGYTGGTEIDAGTFNVSSGSSLGTGPLAVNNTLNSGVGTTGLPVVLNLFNAAQTVGSLSGTITAPATGTNTAAINLATGTVLTINQTTAGVYQGTINGDSTVELVKSGPATLNLSGGVNYTGTTDVTTGSLIFGANATGAIQTITSAGVIVGSNASLVLAPATVHASRSLLVTPSLSIAGTGKLDIGNNDAIVQGGSLATLTAETKTGFAGGTWAGNGITSSSAAGNTAHLTAVGVIQNPGTPAYSTFDGVPSTIADVLIKYTYYGDANLDGVVDGSDYSRIDSSFLSESHGGPAVTGWFNGDFNYDSVVNGSDYTLIDNAYDAQGAALSSELATPTSQIAESGASSAVPEPTAIGILGLFAAGQLSQRRSRRAIKN